MDKSSNGERLELLNKQRSSIDRFEYLKKVKHLIPEQQSDLWFELRYNCANSSQYGTYINRYNRRNQELMKAKNRERTPNNFYMSFGSVFEEASNIPFCAETGLKYETIGSISHPEYPRIRGSVDGYGKDKEGKLFVLETKTPTKRVPTKAISSQEYLYQIIQNIEIVNGDYGLFNDVRLLICPTSCITRLFYGYDPLSGKLAKSSFARYQYANLSKNNEFTACSFRRPSPNLNPVNIICVGLTRDIDHYPESNLELLDSRTPDSEAFLPRREGTISYVLWKKMKKYLCPREIEGGARVQPWIGNLSDVYDNSHPIFTRDDFVDMLISRVFKIIPFGYTRECGDDADEWTNLVFEDIQDNTSCFGCMYFKVDAQLIQMIPRNTKYWKQKLLPIALRWIEDIDYLNRTGDIVGVKTDEEIEIDPPFPDEVEYMSHRM